MLKAKLIIVLILLGAGILKAQSIFEPNYALKNPMTLEIINIETKDDVTLLNISIENQAEGGYYCIEPETYLITDQGEKLRLISLSGLPQCPDVYKFKRVGEIKYVTMQFPSIKKGTSWVDIIEDCDDNCFSIYGLSLDYSLNAKINICFRDIEYGRIQEAITKFEELRIELKDSENPILGSIYLNLISLYEETGDTRKSAELRTELRALIIPHKEKFIILLK